MARTQAIPVEPKSVEQIRKQCAATLRNGNRCTAPATPRTNFCLKHRGGDEKKTGPGRPKGPVIPYLTPEQIEELGIKFTKAADVTAMLEKLTSWVLQGKVSVSVIKAVKDLVGAALTTRGLVIAEKLATLETSLRKELGLPTLAELPALSEEGEEE